jgi:actin-related protein
LGWELPVTPGKPTFFRFAAGKGSALVIDIGQSTASVTPVVDGFVLRKGTTHKQTR